MKTLRNTMLTIAAGLTLLTAVPCHAAESLDAAVREIATKLRGAAQYGSGSAPAGAGSSTGGERTAEPPSAAPPKAATPVTRRRLAVTPFTMPDRRTTAFTNLLMIALTGKMIEVGGSDFRVIERAQLETAMRNLDIEGVPLFDASTASRIGNFLGVNTLLVGEINPLRDAVRIDARLIDVETIETLEQASTWVPLTPTVQEQLAQNVVLSMPVVRDQDAADLRNGVWNGQAQCGDAVIGLALSLIFHPDDTITAMQTYYPVSNSVRGMVSGSLAMEGKYDPGSHEIQLHPASWLFQPQGHGAPGIVGQLNVDRGLFDGVYSGDICKVSDVNLRRIAP